MSENHDVEALKISNEFKNNIIIILLTVVTNVCVKQTVIGYDFARFPCKIVLKSYKL